MSSARTSSHCGAQHAEVDVSHSDWVQRVPLFLLFAHAVVWLVRVFAQHIPPWISTLCEKGFETAHSTPLVCSLSTYMGEQVVA